MSKEIMAAEVGNQAGRGYQLLEGKLLEMEASALVVSDADVFRENQESAWIGCGAPMEECEIMACERERRDQGQITWAMKLKCFPQSVVSHGLGVAAKGLVSWQCTDRRPLGSF